MGEQHKTDELLYVLHTLKDKIRAKKEIEKRRASSPLTEDGVRTLVYHATGDMEEADRAVAHYILQTTKK